MECKNILRAKQYLTRFDEILCEMADRMLSRKVTNSITIDFIECMIPHHQAAIYMCQNLLQYAGYLPLQEIAKNIITTQTKGIEQMQEIARTTSGYFNYPQDIKKYTEKYLCITNNMIERMKNSPRCVNINLSFIGEMIPHHEGAIEMCKNLLQYCIDPRLKTVANSIIQEQSKGVTQMEAVRKKLCSCY